MQFKVPQFLEIEDKIFGPFTFRQFAYLAGGAGICFILYKMFGLFLGAIPIILVAGFSAALTFYRPNEKPFVYMIEAGFKYITQSKLYIWKKRDRQFRDQNNGELENISSDPSRATPGVTGNKLRDLAWSLDVLDLSRNKK